VKATAARCYARPVLFAHAAMSGQSQAGRPPTVHLGSGSRPRVLQMSTVGRRTPRRSAISAMPTGSQLMVATVANLLTTDQACSDTHYMTKSRTTRTVRYGDHRRTWAIRVRRYQATQQADGTWTLEDGITGEVLRTGLDSATARAAVAGANA
jgi:hypothetical protein